MVMDADLVPERHRFESNDMPCVSDNNSLLKIKKFFFSIFGIDEVSSPLD